MKNLKKKFRFRINLKSKHLLAIMTLFCLSCIVATFASGISTAPLQETAGIVIVPFEKNEIQSYIETFPEMLCTATIGAQEYMVKKGYIKEMK